MPRRKEPETVLPAGLEPMLDQTQVAALLSVSDKTVGRMVAAGELPRPAVFTRGARSMKRWSRREVLEHIEARKAG